MEKRPFLQFGRPVFFNGRMSLRKVALLFSRWNVNMCAYLGSRNTNILKRYFVSQISVELKVSLYAFSPSITKIRGEMLLNTSSQLNRVTQKFQS